MELFLSELVKYRRYLVLPESLPPQCAVACEVPVVLIPRSSRFVLPIYKHLRKIWSTTVG